MKKIILIGIILLLGFIGFGYYDQNMALGEAIFQDETHEIYFNRGRMVYQNSDSNNRQKIKLPERNLEVVETLQNKVKTQPPLVGTMIQKGLRLKGKNDLYFVQLEPVFKILTVCPAPVSQSDRIVIDKSENQLFFYQNGDIVKVYDVATGEKPHYTPEGVFAIANKTKTPLEKAEDAQLGVRWMGLKVPNERDQRVNKPDERAPKGLKYGIHGTNEPESIGKHASGGCVRMRNEAVEELYEWVQVGTTVQIRK